MTCRIGTLGNTGGGDACIEGPITGIGVVDENFKITAATELLLIAEVSALATWIAATEQESQRLRPLQNIANAAPEVQEDITETYGNGEIETLREVGDVQVFDFTAGYYGNAANKRVRKLNNIKTSVGVYEFYSKGSKAAIGGYMVEETDNTWSFYPVSLANFKVKKRSQNGFDVGAKVGVRYQYESGKSTNEDYTLVFVDFKVSKIEGLKDVTVAAGTTSSTSVELLVKEGFAGLEDKGNWFVETDAGADQPIAVDLVEGELDETTGYRPYTAAFSTLSAGNYVAGYKTQPDAITPGYEGVNTFTFTIS